MKDLDPNSAKATRQAKQSVTGAYERKRREEAGGLLFNGPKPRQLVERLGLNSGRANVVRMLMTGELEPEAIIGAQFVSKKMHAVMIAIDKIIEGRGLYTLVRGKSGCVDFFNTDYFYIDRPLANRTSLNGNTIMYHVVEKRFVIDDVERLIAKAKRDTRGRELSKGVKVENYHHINIEGIK